MAQRGEHDVVRVVLVFTGHVCVCVVKLGSAMVPMFRGCGMAQHCSKFGVCEDVFAPQFIYVGREFIESEHSSDDRSKRDFINLLAPGMVRASSVPKRAATSAVRMGSGHGTARE